MRRVQLDGAMVDHPRPPVEGESNGVAIDGKVLHLMIYCKTGPDSEKQLLG